ncbi:MAG: adenosylcobinamide-phosphate synthase CbiB [Deltaproteobacteria bacterium]|nr:adenosylcobinamide-phosphate synthase CbiB [Deltaproteobacteria bacterium]
MSTLLTIAALALDSIIGDPQNWPHPVRLIGRLIIALERLYRRFLGRLGGGAHLELFFGAFFGLSVVILSAFIVWFILGLAGLLSSILWLLITLYSVFTIFCLKDLSDHVKRVEKALVDLDIDEARRALSWIVGRDTKNLTIEGIRRATVETIAENYSDGLVAPLFYLAIGGPVLAWSYKAINTLDSMVGYKNSRYLYFGRFSARLDDVANYLPSRLAALLLALGARIARLDHAKAYQVWRKEGRFHSSPNSGQTEAAMAGALGIYLGGPNYYLGQLVDKPVIGQGGKEATSDSVSLAMRLVKVSTILALALAIVIESAVIFCFGAPFGWGLGF